MAIEDDLRSFLLASNRQGYGGGDAKTWERETDGSTTIRFEQGEWRMHDNFFGGEPYGGRQAVLYRGRPLWLLVYYGWVAPEADPAQIYGFLREALREMPPRHPFRGPTSYGSGALAYANAWQGDLALVRGEEQILREDRTVYRALYAGGWVDRRSEA